MCSLQRVPESPHPIPHDHAGHTKEIKQNLTLLRIDVGRCSDSVGWGGGGGRRVHCNEVHYVNNVGGAMPPNLKFGGGGGGGGGRSPAPAPPPPPPPPLSYAYIYSQTSLIRTPVIRAPPSTGQLVCPILC